MPSISATPVTFALIWVLVNSLLRIGALRGEAILSKTDRGGYTPYPSNVLATSRSQAPIFFVDLPARKSSLVDGSSRPAITFNVGVLPAPVGPGSVNNSPYPM